MNYGNILPVTGGAGAFLLGRYLGLDDIIGVAIVAVLFGITAYRYGSRLGDRRTTKLTAAATVLVATAVTAHLAGTSWATAVIVALVLTAVALYAMAALAERASKPAAASYAGELAATRVDRLSAEQGWHR